MQKNINKAGDESQGLGGESQAGPCAAPGAGDGAERCVGSSQELGSVTKESIWGQKA